MTITKLKQRPLMTTPDPDHEDTLSSEVRRADRALTIARVGAAALVRRAPRAMGATKAGATSATSSLQTLPDSTLRWMAAGAIGLGAGLYLRGTPRILVAAGMAPAALLGAAMVLRPGGSVVAESADQ